MKAIFAVDINNGFASGDTMPWPRSKSDLARFKMITDGFTVVMGSGTWNSNIPRPFPNRRNCVLSTSLVDDRCEVYKDVTHLLENIKNNEIVFVIGGEKTLWQLRQFINEIYLTTFFSSNKADIVFNTEEYLKDFELSSLETLEDHKFEIFKRKMS